MNRPNRWMAASLLFLSLAGCSQPSRLERSLALSGENRSELEQVLEHYREDPEKLKAARFLIENMPGHYSYGGHEVERYYDRVDSVFSLSLSPKEKKEILEKISGQVNRSKIKPIADICVITAGLLTDHIDRAFSQWKNLEWNSHLSFDDFCEYLLPYKNAEGDYLEQWREPLQSLYNRDLDYICECDYFRKSSFQACKEICEAMPRRNIIPHDAIPILRLSTLAHLSYGHSCNEYTLMSQALMRSKGIPVASDFTPQWNRHGEGHTWNVVLSNSGKNIVFSGGETSPGDNHMHIEKRAKVFRSTYAINHELEELLLSGEKPPAVFSCPFIKDVTSEYEEALDVVYPIDKNRIGKSRYAYLCLSQSQSWKPVHWGKIEGNKVRFTNMGKDCVYLPVVYSDGNQIPIGNPFHLNNQGDGVEFAANLQDTLCYTLKRKFPIQKSIYSLSKHYLEARFEASNNVDFKNADTLYTIKERVYTTLSVTPPPSTPKYRYWRFITGRRANYCNVAELLFYDRQTGEELTGGKPIGSEDSIRNSNTSKEVVFDHDGLTCFFSRQKDSTWVGLDFGQPVDVGCIVFAPRSDDNNVWPGDTYELKYWGENGWLSLGMQKSTGIQLSYSNIPKGALLLLSNLTKGKQERIFSIENDKLIWW